MSTPHNIIVVFTDQQRWDTCGCYGQSLPVTPNLDAMAREGTQFRYAFTAQPVCGPSRAVVQTGTYATETGCYNNGIALHPDEDTIAKRLRSAEYDTGYIGKWHLASTLEFLKHNAFGRPIYDYGTEPIPPALRGGYLDDWLAADLLEYTSHGEGGYMFDGDGRKVEFTRYRVEALTDYAVDFLRTRTLEHPFFLFLSYLEPHHQNDRERYEGPPGSTERWASATVPGDVEGVELDGRENYPEYLGCVNALDTALGRIREEIARRGIAHDTVIIFTSDHGNHFRTRNEAHKLSCHESSLRIPLVATGPGFTGGGVRDAFASLIDIAPTVLTAAGMDVPHHMRGRPLQDVPAGRTDDWRTSVFAQISGLQMGRTVRTDRWKYTVDLPGVDARAHASSDVYYDAFLYDLHADPHEHTNLVADPAYADVRAELREELLKYIEDVEGARPEIHPLEPRSEGTASAQ